MNDSTHYFIARGRSQEAIEKFIADREAGMAGAQALMDRLGAKNVYFQGQRLVGFVFERSSGPTDTKLLRRDRNTKDMWVPSARYQPGKDLRDEMKDCGSGPDTFRLMRDLIGTGFMITGRGPGSSMMAGTPGYEKIGDDWVISMPARMDGTVPAPYDAVPLKRSDYWARKEAACRVRASPTGNPGGLPAAAHQ